MKPGFGSLPVGRRLWRPCHQPRLPCISISAGQHCRPSFGIRQRQSTWTSVTSRTGAGTRSTVVDGCLSGLPSKTAAKPVESSCSVVVSSHAEGTANVARLVRVALHRSLEMWRGMCQQWRPLIYLLIYWSAGNCHNSSNHLFFSYEYAEQGNSCSHYLCYFLNVYVYLQSLLKFKGWPVEVRFEYSSKLF